MSVSPSSSSTPVEDNKLGKYCPHHLVALSDTNRITERVATNGSEALEVIDEDEDPNHPIHKQDWNIKTDPKDSWANRERRRSSVWAKFEMSTSPKMAPSERRGSILSMWTGGKDKDGKDILSHNDEESSSSEEEPLKEEVPAAQEEQPVVHERRGSILSLWTGGKDENGRPIILHHDDEWKV